MANFGVQPTGYISPTFNDLINESERLLKASNRFTETLNFDTNSNAYQLFAVFCNQLVSLEQRAEQVFNAHLLTKSEGNNLNSIGAYIGISKNNGIKATGTVTFSGVSGVVIPVNFLVGNTAGVNFVTTTSSVIETGGTVNVPIQAVNVGVSGNLPVNNITAIVEPLTGLNNVTNAAVTTGGQNAETDTEFRNRYMTSTSFGGGTTVDSIKSVIDAVSGVQDSRVIENDTDGTVNGQPEKSVQAIIQGGSNANLFQAIYSRKPIGISTFGTVSGTVTDSQGNSHTISFNRPTTTDIYYRVVTTKTSDFPSNGLDTIKAAVLNLGTNFKIGESVTILRVYEAISSLNLIGLTNAVVTLSTDGTTYNTNTITIGSTSIAITENDKIEVT